MTEAIKKLKPNQYSFIEREIGPTKAELLSMGEDELDDIYDKLCDIETHEAMQGDEMSDRGNKAADIVTILGEAYRDMYYDEYIDGDDIV